MLGGRVTSSAPRIYFRGSGCSPRCASHNRARAAGQSAAKLRAADRPALRHLSHRFCRPYPIRPPFQDSRLHGGRRCLPHHAVSWLLMPAGALMYRRSWPRPSQLKIPSAPRSGRPEALCAADRDDGDRRVHQHASAASSANGPIQRQQQCCGVARKLLLGRRHHGSYRRVSASDLQRAASREGLAPIRSPHIPGPGTIPTSAMPTRRGSAPFNVTYGITANNNPTVQDPWNTTPAWAFPYAVSTLG